MTQRPSRSRSHSRSGQWPRGTGADFFGSLFGTVAGVTAYVVADVATINRFPPDSDKKDTSLPTWPCCR